MKCPHCSDSIVAEVIEAQKWQLSDDGTKWAFTGCYRESIVYTCQNGCELPDTLVMQLPSVSLTPETP
jgi:hypothetical protein